MTDKNLLDKIAEETARRMKNLIPDMPVGGAQKAVAPTKAAIDPRIEELTEKGCRVFCGALHLGNRLPGPRLFSLEAAWAHFKGWPHHCVPAGVVSHYAINCHKNEDRKAYLLHFSKLLAETCSRNGHEVPTFNESDNIVRFNRPDARIYASNIIFCDWPDYQFTI